MGMKCSTWKVKTPRNKVTTRKTNASMGSAPPSEFSSAGAVGESGVSAGAVGESGVSEANDASGLNTMSKMMQAATRGTGKKCLPLIL
jgi:hypothetical protein